MSRDYKSRSNTNTGRRNGGLFSGLIIGYILGLASAIGVWLFISQAPSPYLNESQAILNQPTEKASPSIQPDNKSIEKTQAAENKSRFDFYNILPGIEEPDSELFIDPAPTAAAPTTPSKAPPPPPAKVASTTPEPVKYYLQAGSFSSRDAAERRKAELALLGIVATVITQKSGNNAAAHRVQIGPFNKMEELDRIRGSLQSNGITTSLVSNPG
ncbi:SPOR domain-containing protein [Nitrosomonas mobilis]|uniref:Sporulation domain protein n=1 Tax=Nitrosomonas mobilis TaxID=51642 RepID=A0A1G5SFG7_9PROT|nr:SPOR domain-containing protein [Nitrosomonas mobilis]SCZ85934.1 Sporulation domain protein [Nitrosomonas mobilis]